MTIVDWRDWCLHELHAEHDFKFAWFSLGLCQAALTGDLGEEYDFVEAPFAPDASYRDLADLENSLSMQLHTLVETCMQRDLRIPWRFPVSAGTLRAMPPTFWRDAGLDIELRNVSGVTLRVKLLDPREPRSQAATRALLGRHGIVDRIVSGDHAGRDAQLRLAWPLRIAYFADNKPVDALDGLEPASPAGALTRRFALGRDRSKCDVLVFWGSAAQLIARVRAGPGRIKGNLLLLVSKSVPAASTLDELLGLTRASGVLVLEPLSASGRIDEAINAFVSEFSLDRMLDTALALGLEQHIRVKFVQLSEPLARARIRDVAAALADRFAPQPTSASAPEMANWDGFVIPPPPAGPPLMDAVFDHLEGLEATGAGGGGTLFGDLMRNYSTASEGAAVLADNAEAPTTAPVPRDNVTPRADRFLQQRPFVLTNGRARAKAAHGFIAGTAAEVDLRIGPLDADWQPLEVRFVDDALFSDSRPARLTVWLTEPAQLAKPVEGKLSLPLEGASAPCTLRFTPLKAGPFEGRITVLHNGRVVQTALLVAEVAARASELDPSAKPPRLQKTIPVRRNLGDIAGRRSFGLAFVENHTLAGEVRTVALSPGHAWIADASPLLDHWMTINNCLTKVAHSTADFVDGIEGKAGTEILIRLARNGSSLNNSLIGEHLNRPGNNAAIASEEYIQIVSMRSQTIPIEFVYDFPTPAKTAALCEHWRDGVANGKCPGTCAGGTKERVCPMGFWGLSKVIERHQLSTEHSAAGKNYYLQSEPTRQSDAIKLSGPVVFSRSRRVTDDSIEKVRQALDVPDIDAAQVNSWKEWATAVNGNPRLILSMPHTDGQDNAVTLEISGDQIESIDIDTSHVCPQPHGKPPLVILLGCDVAQASDAFSRHLAAFNGNGAAAIVATIATVNAAQAAAVAAMLASELLKKRDKPFRLGEAIRDVKRQALLQNLIMPLCVVAYGDADWRLE
ncbi:MAG: hypothetical protein V4857_01785 [Pseudomonadota bacterium]